MQQKSDPHIFSGMQRDMSISKHKAESLYDAMNIRFTARDGDTMLSITNEKGTLLLSDLSMQGTYLDHCVINDYVIVFTHSTNTSLPDYIYKVTPIADNNIDINLLYNGNLNFDIEHPIETLGIYETDSLQKVYWVDGKNQPRLLWVNNVSYVEGGDNDDSQFDFVPTLNLEEEVTVEKIHGEGVFAPGVIQYAFSYYNLYKQQSNIFITTPLQYISFIDRGGSPEDRISNIFKVTIKHLDTRFDFLRVYSIHRTSIDAVPTVKRVVDIELNGRRTITFQDNGTIGDNIDLPELLYVGGDLYSVNTIDTKDNVLFLANYRMLREIPIPIEADFSGDQDHENIFSAISIEKSIIKNTGDSGYYSYTSSLDSPIHGFKNREHYRLGFQLQHKSGKWSPPYFLGDYTIQTNLVPDLIEDGNTVTYKSLGIEANVDLSQYIDTIREMGYIKIRPVCVFPSINDRLVLTQGLLCPTVFGINNRIKNAPYAQSSWFFRLNPNTDISNYSVDNFYGDWVEFRHLHSLKSDEYYGGEIMGAELWYNQYITDENKSASDCIYAIDQSVLTMHSPEVEFDDTINFLKDTSYKLRLVGIANFNSTYWDASIETSSPTMGGPGFISPKKGVINSPESIKGLSAGAYWSDYRVKKDENGNYSKVGDNGSPYRWVVYPWHRSGSLNNDETREADKGVRTSELKSKKIGNFRFSKNNTWFTTPKSYNITPFKVFDSDQKTIVNIDVQNSSLPRINRVYYGNEDFMIGKPSDFNIHYAGDLVGAIERLTAINPVGSVRMQYKSSKHLVLELMNDTTTNRPIILPSINNLNRTDPDINYIPSWYVNSDSSSTNRLLTEIENVYMGTDFNTYVSAHQDDFTNEYTKFQKSLWVAWDDSSLNRGTLYILLASEVVDQNTDEVTYNWYQLTDLAIYQQYITTYYKVNTRYYKLNIENGKYIIEDTGEEEIPEDIQKSDYKVLQDNITLGTLDYPYLFLGELYREPNYNTDFGGPISQSRESLLWLPAGETKLIENNLNNGWITIDFTEGDTWYTRYDCLKTYPYAEDSTNSIIEVGSFMCESRVNGDGRYDNKRGQLQDLLYFRPTNFNLMNSIYSQKDNFFNYRSLPQRFYDLNTFPNQVTWTLVKQPAQEIDFWTNLSMAATADMDGSNGQITSLTTFGDTIYCFQETAINQLLFNSRVQIPTSDGVPVEISNSGKYDGNRLISDSVGTKNKWSICKTPRGLYFIDDYNKRIYGLSDKLTSLSDALGMDNWLKELENISQEKTFYDSVNQDLYFTWDTTCLVFSTILGQFTSFMNYEGTPAMFNIHNNFYAFRNNSTLDMYQMFAGQYNDFFGTIQPFYIHFISNADSSLDKIFSTIETRVDFKQNGEVVHNEFFNRLRVWNEYQDTGTKDISKGTTAFRKDAKKKFRIWRVNIPRCGKHNLDRIRNTWTNIKLGKDNPGNLKMELHDINVQYFI